MPKSLTGILARADSLADRFEDFEPTMDEQKRDPCRGALGHDAAHRDLA